MGWKPALLLAALAAYFIGHALAKTREPLKVFEWEYFSAAESSAAGGPPLTYGSRKPAVEHAPLYVHLLALAMKAGGPGVRPARVLGVLLTLAACAALLPLAAAAGAGPAGFSAAAALFLTLPPVIQGSTVLGAADTGLLPPLLLLCFAAMLHFRREPRPLAGAGVALLFSLCLWSKFTTSLALPLFFVGESLLRRDPAGVRRDVLLFSAGFAIFGISWAFYSRAVAGLEYFWMPLTYAFEQVGAGLPSGGLGERLARTGGELARALSWISPFLLAAAALAAGPAAGRRSGAAPLLAFGGLVFLVYAAVRGTGGGFPKYQLPALGFFCLAAGSRLAAELKECGARERVFLGLAACAAGLYSYFFLGDHVLYVQELVRYASLKGVWPAAREAVPPFLAYLAPFGLVLAAAARVCRGRGRAVFLSCVCLAAGYNVAQNALQLNAPYSTTYAYGTSGAGEAAGFLRRSVRPDAAVIGAFETLYAAGNRRGLLMPAEAWNSPAGFLAYAESVRPEAVVYGLGTNTARQQQEVFGSEPVRGYLSASFSEHVFGSYTVWLRRSVKK